MCKLCLKDYQNLKKISTKEIEYNPYLNQEEWKTYQNYYTVLKSPINIDSSKVIKSCKSDFAIKYKNTIFLVVKHGGIPYLYPLTEDNYVLYENTKYTLINFH